ncbi:MAG: LacI family DNA-binding transcriptional regulator [Opitutaceae bacterium]|nr:LacI family DNA-binding transcriptional regulator [Opitutaceae bacterium]
MGRRIFMQDVADAAGVHRTTVSLALRDHPRIPAKTRAHVKALAEKLGYVTDPLVAALMHARRTRSPTPQHAALAYVTSHPTRYGWRDNPVVPDFFPGALARARFLGYKLEDFWLREPQMTPRRFSQILRTRNIHGLIMAPPPRGVHALALDWENFCSVTLGVGLASPEVHRVADNHFHTFQTALRTCAERGLYRIGFCYPVDDYQVVTEKRLAAYQIAPLEHPRITLLPPLCLEAPREKNFLAWVRRHRPEVIINTIVESDPRDWLERARFAVPRDVSLVSLVLHTNRGWMSGVYHDPAINASVAVDLLVGLIHRHERGIPPQAHDVMIRGHWVEGRSIRPSPAAKARSRAEP